MVVDLETLSYHVHEFGDVNSRDVLVALHGFTGSGMVFEQFSDHFRSLGIKLLAVDLPGHGKTSTPNSTEVHAFDAQLSNFSRLIRKLEIPRFHLLGYSMGGRIALHYALKYPDKIISLILESTNNGISNDLERLDRVSRDESLSEQIIQDYADFLLKWNRLPLFQSPPNAIKRQIDAFKNIQVNQDPIQMALSLREFSPGKIPYVYNELSLISCPVLAITGDNDYKYIELWKSLSNKINNGIHINIEHAGHRVHLDQPDKYLETIVNFIKSTIK
ncbi:MAG TPA: 2-succinyl-6-hydroxy-2,4-cyclohexadiene-1-carboxylate synthase [Bacteroidetes bacterium]|nr:2-succinyl-6-hydroxy-2,4-cyclohexadiene-1-carboxylate synthase [Bacteroidota bacterium]